jgi:hypothetical protein
MLKTLRITSILAAVLAAGLFVCPAVFGFRSDKAVQEFLSLPGVVEKFRQTQGSKTKQSKDQVSPLVAQAEAFGKYLRPPQPRKAKKVVKGPKPPPGQPPPPPPPRVSVKFKVIATSFYATQPELSLALIDEPGKGRNWIRQGSKLGHLTIEQIKDGVVVARGGKKVFEQPVEARPPQRSLLAGSSPVSTGTSDVIDSEIAAAVSSDETVSAAEIGAGITRQQVSPEEMAKVEKMFAELLEMAAEGQAASGEADDSGSKAKEGTEATGERISDAEAMRITGKEAKKLGRLGQPKDGKQDPNRPKSRKVENSSKERRKPKESSSRSKPKRRTTPKKSNTTKKGR